MNVRRAAIVLFVLCLRELSVHGAEMQVRTDAEVVAALGRLPDLAERLAERPSA